MARKMNLKSRPGLLFVIILIVCFIILYYSWRSMASQKHNHPPINLDTQYRGHREYKNSYVHERKKLNPSFEYQNKELYETSMISRQSKAKQKKMANMKFATQSAKASDLNQYSLTAEKSNINRFKNFPSLRTSELKEVSDTPYYSAVDTSISHILMSMERFVHLDLKGAAPKLSYLKDLFPLLNKMGATGLLIEYEDTFPYSGTLKDLAAKNAYSLEEIDEIQIVAKMNGLKIMPLIQTFGHMEYVLKHADRQYFRESSHTPQVIRSDKNSTYILIAEMINQMLDAHEEATRLHIGCDEVYELGRGVSHDVTAREGVTVEQLFLRHVTHVAKLVRNYGRENNRKVTPVMWDDELRKISFENIEDSSLHELVEIMIWKYTPDVMDSITDLTWKKYSKLFPHVWIASSFKGATGARQFYTAPDYHISNHFSWLKVIAMYGDKIQFTGITLTGWQRFDHFATLCELIPAAVPSLAVCLATMRYGGFNEQIHKNTSRLLGCNNLIEMKVPDVDPKTFEVKISQDCRFPGSHFYYALQEFYGYRMMNKKLEKNMEGQLSDYQIVHGYSNPGYLSFLMNKLNDLNTNYTTVSKPIKEELLKIYSMETVEEWLEEHIFERIRRNNDYLSKVKKLLSNTSWKRRPFDKIDIGKELFSAKGKVNQAGSKLEPSLLHLPSNDQSIHGKNKFSSSVSQNHGSKNDAYKKGSGFKMDRPSGQENGRARKNVRDISPNRNLNNILQFEERPTLKKHVQLVSYESKITEGMIRKKGAKAIKSNNNMPVVHRVLSLPNSKDIQKQTLGTFKQNTGLSFPIVDTDETKIAPKHSNHTQSMPMLKRVPNKLRHGTASDTQDNGTKQRISFESYKKKAADFDSSGGKFKYGDNWLNQPKYDGRKKLGNDHETAEGRTMVKNSLIKNTNRVGEVGHKVFHLKEQTNRRRFSDKLLEKSDIPDKQMTVYEQKLLRQGN